METQIPLEIQVLLITASVGILIGLIGGYFLHFLVSAYRNHRVTADTWNEAEKFYSLQQKDPVFKSVNLRNQR